MANSTTSRPRWMSPLASAMVLPCSRASSSASASLSRCDELEELASSRGRGAAGWWRPRPAARPWRSRPRALTSAWRRARPARCTSPVIGWKTVAEAARRAVDVLAADEMRKFGRHAKAPVSAMPAWPLPRKKVRREDSTSWPSTPKLVRRAPHRPRAEKHPASDGAIGAQSLRKFPAPLLEPDRRAQYRTPGKAALLTRPAAARPLGSPLFLRYREITQIRRLLILKGRHQFAIGGVHNVGLLADLDPDVVRRTGLRQPSGAAPPLRTAF